MGYASARVLEALLEGLLAPRLLEEGYTRNAAGKVFQAWKALVEALLALEKEKLEKIANREEGRWLVERCSPCTPSSRLKDQYHGLGLDAELVSKYGRGRRAAVDAILPVRTLVELAEEKVKPRLEEEHVCGVRSTAEHYNSWNTGRNRRRSWKTEAIAALYIGPLGKGLPLEGG